MSSQNDTKNFKKDKISVNENTLELIFCIEKDWFYFISVKFAKFEQQNYWYNFTQTLIIFEVVFNSIYLN